MRVVRPTLIIIGIVQIALGVVFLIPNAFPSMLGLPDAPAWATWMLTMFSARAFGFGYGMLRRGAVAPGSQISARWDAVPMPERPAPMMRTS